MIFMIVTIVICWIVGVLLLKRAGYLAPMQELMAAQKISRSAPTAAERRAAAQRILDLIERYDLTGVVVEDARKSAETLLRGWARH